MAAEVCRGQLTCKVQLKTDRVSEFVDCRLHKRLFKLCKDIFLSMARSPE